MLKGGRNIRLRALYASVMTLGAIPSYGVGEGNYHRTSVQHSPQKGHLLH